MKKKRSRGLGGALGDTPQVGDTKCVYNPRTKQWRKLGFFGKSTKSRSGWTFVKGSCKAGE